MDQVEYQERRTRRWLVEYPRAVPLAIFLMIAAITAMSLFAIERGAQQRDHAQLQETAKAVASALERRGGTSSSYLRAGAALFATLDDISPSLFRRFVNELRLDEDYRGAEGIGWATAIMPEELADYESRYGLSIADGRGVFPAHDDLRKWMVPVTLLQPENERSRRAIGFDMYSDEMRREAMDEAERTIRPTATGRVVLLQEGEESAPGFLIYMPVFELDGNGRALKGFIYSPFNAQNFLSSALELETRGRSGVRLYDGEASPDRLLAQLKPEIQTGETVTESVVIANRPMTLVVESARSQSLSQLSLATLIFGLMVASLLMIVARLLTQQAMEDRASLEWLQEQHSIRDSLTRELNHRVKNTLANVLSIIALTRRRSESLDEFADGIDGRIRSLSATHDLLTQSEWGTTPIGAVIDAELAHYRQGADRRAEVDGPLVELAPNDALSLGLAIHELSTNAAKYGALSPAGGKVSVTWTVKDGMARVTWQEIGGPPVATTRKRGFGTDLIEKIVAHELSSPVELEFDPTGVRCVITVPIRTPSDFAMRAKR